MSFFGKKIEKIVLMAFFILEIIYTNNSSKWRKFYIQGECIMVFRTKQT